MHIPALINDRLPRSVLARQVLLAVLALLVGVLVMPGLIYLCGSLLLGRYDGAAVSKTYSTLLSGLAGGSVSSWIVVLGPYALWQLQRVLRLLWRVGAVRAE